MTKQLLDYYPNFDLQDNFVVVDTKKNNKVVAWLCLIRKKGYFENLEINYGQMDMVGTQQDYRNKGLIRQLSNSFDEKAEYYELPFLVVLGIPYFYKKLGYEYAIPLEGSIRFPTEIIPNLRTKGEEIYYIERVKDLTNFKTYLKIRNMRNKRLDLYQEIKASSFHFYNIQDLQASDEVRHFYLIINRN